MGTHAHKPNRTHAHLRHGASNCVEDAEASNRKCNNTAANALLARIPAISCASQDQSECVLHSTLELRVGCLQYLSTH